jgi:hypothetical protein
MFVPALLGKKKEQKMTNLLYVVPSAMILLHELGELRIYLEKSDPALCIEFQANDAYLEAVDLLTLTLQRLRTN